MFRHIGPDHAIIYNTTPLLHQRGKGEQIYSEKNSNTSGPKSSNWYNIVILSNTITFVNIFVQFVLSRGFKARIGILE